MARLYKDVEIDITFLKKLRADLSTEMTATIQCRIFCLPVCYAKI
jgi:hypothetical protein